MKKFLVDANVLSEATRERPLPQVLDWLAENQRSMVVNPIVLGELEYGILGLPSGKKRNALQTWFDSGARNLALVEIDAATAGHWAQLLAELKRKGRAMPVKDSLIAASARQHGLVVATRNTSDFRFAGVDLVNPFDCPEHQ